MKCSELHKPAGHSGGPSKALRETTKFVCDVSLRHFALWTPQPAGWPKHEEESDSSASHFILSAWPDDRTRILVTNFISEISDAEPSLRSLLVGAERLYLAGIKHGLRGRGCPIPWWVTCAITGTLLLWLCTENCTMVLLGHRGRLRANEYLNSYSRDFVIEDLVPKGPVSLTSTKTSTERVYSKLAAMTDPDVLLFSPICCPNGLPDKK